MIQHAFSTLMPFLLPGLAILLLVSAFNLYWPAISGWLGERKVRLALAGLSSDDGYIVLHDLMLACKDGHTTQIDHIVCAPSGIFVIETKNHAGYIYGKASDAQWAQAMNKYSKFRFQNPIFQNVRHVNAVRRIIEGVPVRNVVLFVRGHFPNGMPEGVFSLEALTEHIRSFEDAKNSHDPLAMQQKLLAADMNSPEVRKAHALRLQKIHGGKWRIPLAHAMTIGAVVLLVTTPPSEVRESNNRSITPELHFSIPPNHESKAASPAKPSTNRPATPIQVVAMSNNRAAIIEDGKIITLNTGQASPRGWQLSSASPRHAVLISPDGRRFTFGNAPPKGE